MGFWIQSMKPRTSRTATGSLKPDSPSRVRATRRRSVEPRSSAKIAALSVAATIEPRSSPSSVLKSNSQAAASPARTAVMVVPITASDSAAPSTGRISPMPAARPPSKRISDRAMTPMVSARR